MGASLLFGNVLALLADYTFKRIITFGHNTDTPFTLKETEELEGVYRILRDYLVTKEQVRSFTTEQLDDLVRKRYNISIS
ncbi:MAG: hypothetical protein AAB834_07130 [Patescibacteria group bacterium]